MSRNGCSTRAPSRTTRIRPPCSTTKIRPVPSSDGTTSTGLARPDATVSRRRPAGASVGSGVAVAAGVADGWPAVGAALGPARRRRRGLAAGQHEQRPTRPATRAGAGTEDRDRAWPCPGCYQASVGRAAAHRRSGSRRVGPATLPAGRTLARSNHLRSRCPDRPGRSGRASARPAARPEPARDATWLGHRGGPPRAARGAARPRRPRGHRRPVAARPRRGARSRPTPGLGGPACTRRSRAASRPTTSRRSSTSTATGTRTPTRSPPSGSTSSSTRTRSSRRDRALDATARRGRRRRRRSTSCPATVHRDAAAR